jgi:putative endonuclease
MTGSVGYHAGRVAEDIVAGDYICRNYNLAARRWRGQAGEIDLIMRDGDEVVFVEVKKAKCFAKAGEKLGRRRMDRICAAAQEFLAGEPGGQLTHVRFDLAMVDGHGAVKVIENAFMEL